MTIRLTAHNRGLERRYVGIRREIERDEAVGASPRQSILDRRVASP